MSVIRFEKVVSALPGTLTPDTLYMVRVGAGFDFYVSDSTGSVAHQINGSAVNLPTTVTQAEAEAGTLTEERTFTPQRVAQAIAALAQGSSDILVYASYVAFPATGTVGKLYLTENSGSLYAWIGSSYVNLTELTSHTHGINDVIGLQSNLDSKASLTGAAFSGDVSSTGVITATIGMVSNGDFFGYGQGYFDNVLSVNNHVNLASGSSYLINGVQHTHVKANITDFNDADYATAAQGTKADSAVQPADLASYATTASLATVATSGSYNDLTNLPSLFDGAYGSLSGLPSLGTASPLNVAATGDAAANEIVKGNDTRLADARTPAAHTHTKADITDFPSVISQAEAEAGAATTERLWTAQRVAQAITALGGGGGGGGGGGSIDSGTSAERPASPLAPMLFYNTSLNGLELYYPNIDTWEVISTFTSQVDPTSDSGQALYTAPGTHTWICPANVYQVDVVCVGGGGSGAFRGRGGGSGSGGGGGGLGYANSISVTPGQSYTVVVGPGGAPIGTPYYGGVGNNGGNSYFISTGTVLGGGGKGGSRATLYVGGVGGSYFPLGGNGGNGGDSGVFRSAGGGGAGGYSGSGGAGGTATEGGVAGAAGTGGGGGGGGEGNYRYLGGGGGGVGLLGEGTSGTGGAGSATSHGTPGAGGSGGANGANSAGGAYGGGGAGGNYNQAAGSGTDGAVRIIWGPGRAFPSTNTGDV